MKKTLFLPIFIASILVFSSCGNNSNSKTKNKAETSSDVATPNTPSDNSPSKSGKTFTEADLRYHQKPVILTKHARCRMGCRHIDASEIQEMLKNGVVNTRKSGQSKDEATCPTQAIEGKTHDNQTVRIVVAECDTKVKIVTVIDLKNEFKCTCD